MSGSGWRYPAALESDQAPFIVGMPPIAGFDRVVVRYLDSGDDAITPGILPYWYFDVLYDQANGVIGLRVH